MSDRPDREREKATPAWKAKVHAKLSEARGRFADVAEYCYGNRNSGQLVDLLKGELQTSHLVPKIDEYFAKQGWGDPDPTRWKSPIGEQPAVTIEPKSKVHRNIRLLRERADFDLEGAADAANVATQTWLEWERGDREPTFSELELIANTLGHEPSHFWLDDPPPTTLGPADLLWARRRLFAKLPPEVQERLRAATQKVIDDMSPDFVATKKAQTQRILKQREHGKNKKKR